MFGAYQVQIFIFLVKMDTKCDTNTMVAAAAVVVAAVAVAAVAVMVAAKQNNTKLQKHLLSCCFLPIHAPIVAL